MRKRVGKGQKKPDVFSACWDSAVICETQNKGVATSCGIFNLACLLITLKTDTIIVLLGR